MHQPRADIISEKAHPYRRHFSNLPSQGMTTPVNMFPGWMVALFFLVPCWMGPVGWGGVTAWGGSSTLSSWRPLLSSPYSASSPFCPGIRPNSDNCHHHLRPDDWGVRRTSRTSTASTTTFAYSSRSYSSSSPDIRKSRLPKSHTPFTSYHGRHDRASAAASSSSLWAGIRPSTRTRSSSSSKSILASTAGAATSSSSSTFSSWPSSTQTSPGRLWYRDRDQVEEEMTATTTSTAKTTSTNPWTVPSTRISSPSFDPPSSTTSPIQPAGLRLDLIRTLLGSQALLLLVTTAVMAMGHGMVAPLIHSILLLDGTSLDLNGILSNSAPLMQTLQDLVFQVGHWVGPGIFREVDTHMALPVPLMEVLLAAGTAAVLVTGHSTLVEMSRHRHAHYMQFSAMNLVLTLFGRRHQSSASSGGTTSSMQVVGWSSMLALCTALTEEMVFRGCVGATLYQWTSSWPLAMLGQALLFGAAHIHPDDPQGESQWVAAWQTSVGLVYGLLWAMTGSMATGIFTHMMVDMALLVGTWHRVNDQLDWIEVAYAQQQPTSRPQGHLAAEKDEAQDEEGQAWSVFLEQIKRSRIRHRQSKEPPSSNNDVYNQHCIERAEDQDAAEAAATLALLRRFFYAFDSQHVHSLSLDDVQRAVSYAFLSERQHAPPPQDQVRVVFEDQLARRPASRHRRVGQVSSPPRRRVQVTEFIQILWTLRRWATQQQKQRENQPAQL